MKAIQNLLLAACLALATTAHAGEADEVGKAVVDVYIGTMKDTAALLAGNPPSDDVRETFRTEKEESIQKLVALGRQVEQMSESDRAVVRSAVSSANSKLQYDPELKRVYTAYTEAAKPYFSADRPFYKELQAINILTQYAFFDLLRKQAPEEAQRLGV